MSQPVITDTDCTFLSQLKETERATEKPVLPSFQSQGDCPSASKCDSSQKTTV